MTAKTESEAKFCQGCTPEFVEELCSDGVTRKFYQLDGLQGVTLSVVSKIGEAKDKDEVERAGILYEYQLIYTAMSLEQGLEGTWQEIAKELRTTESEFQEELYTFTLRANVKKTGAAPDQSPSAEQDG